MVRRKRNKTANSTTMTKEQTQKVTPTVRVTCPKHVVITSFMSVCVCVTTAMYNRG